MDELEIIRELAVYVKGEMDREEVSFDDVMDFLTGEVQRVLNNPE